MWDRTPTGDFPRLDEARDAIATGLFTYGEGGFNSYESAPGSGPGVAYDDVLRWSSTLSSNKKYGFTRRWVWRPLSGDTGEIPETSSIDVIFVRTHVP